MSGKKHGAGTYKFTNGNVYTGQFELDKKHGHGTMHWENGNKCVASPWNGEGGGGGPPGGAGGWEGGGGGAPEDLSCECLRLTSK